MRLETAIETARSTALSVADEPLDTLPLLERYRRHKKANLDRVHSLFVQHHLAPFFARVQAMFQDGLDPSKAWFVDIPYSTSQSVRQRLLKKLPSDDHLAEPFCDPFGDYNTAQRSRVRVQLEQLAGRSGDEAVLIIDDGAYVLRVLSSSDVPDDLRKRFKNARVVEQTTRGHRFLESAEGHRLVQELDIVAVSVARTATKVRFEAPAIGDAVGRAAREMVTQQGMRPKHALIIGFGSVGAATARELREQYRELTIDVVDVSRDRRQFAEEQLFRTHCVVPTPENTTNRYDLVVGCTGGTSFTQHNFGILAEVAVLASGSSAAVEFDRARLVKWANRDLHDDFELLTDRESEASNIRANIRFAHGQNNQFTILRAGWPVNFDGRPKHIPTVLIQPTHCLLYSAVVQALTHDSPGFRLLEPAEDYWILSEAVKDLTAALKDADVTDLV